MGLGGEVDPEQRDHPVGLDERHRVPEEAEQRADRQVDVAVPGGVPRVGTGQQVQGVGHQLVVAVPRLEQLERRDRIVWVIRHHIFHHSWQLQKPEDLSKKQRRYLADPKFPLLLEFLRIDSLASHGNPGGMEAYDFYEELPASIS